MNKAKKEAPRTLEELVAQLKKKGFVPVTDVKAQPTVPEESQLPVVDFNGTLLEFRDTCRKFRAKAIFVSTLELSEEHFLYKFTGEKLPKPINLAAREPRLKNFKKYLGKIFAYELSCSMSEAILRLRLKEDWYEEFEQLYSQAILTFDVEYEQKRQQAGFKKWVEDVERWG